MGPVLWCFVALLLGVTRPLWHRTTVGITWGRAVPQATWAVFLGMRDKLRGSYKRPELMRELQGGFPELLHIWGLCKSGFYIFQSSMAIKSGGHGHANHSSHLPGAWTLPGRTRQLAALRIMLCIPAVSCHMRSSSTLVTLHYSSMCREDATSFGRGQEALSQAGIVDFFRMQG